MSTYFSDLAAQTAEDGTISPEEILILRRASWADGQIDADEAEAILAVNDRILAHDPAWSAFFVEALGEFVLNGAPPLGAVDEAKADWLMARIDQGGRLESMAALELLMKLLGRAGSVPDRLRTYAIDQVARAVLTGEGPTRQGGASEAQGIGETEAGLLRRLIFAPASGRPARVSRDEAELLFRIKDAVRSAGNAADWRRLFVQGAASFLMAYTIHEPLSRERAAEFAAFLAQPDDTIGRFLARMAQFDAQSGFTRVFGQPPPREEAIDAGEAIDEYEQALMDFLAEEGRG